NGRSLGSSASGVSSVGRLARVTTVVLLLSQVSIRDKRAGVRPRRAAEAGGSAWAGAPGRRARRGRRRARARPRGGTGRRRWSGGRGFRLAGPPWRSAAAAWSRPGLPPDADPGGGGRLRAAAAPPHGSAGARRARHAGAAAARPTGPRHGRCRAAARPPGERGL